MPIPGVQITATNKSPLILIATWLLLVLAAFAYIMRSIVKISRQAMRFELDDYLLTGALVLFRTVDSHHPPSRKWVWKTFEHFVCRQNQQDYESRHGGEYPLRCVPGFVEVVPPSSSSKIIPK
ncbi:hypothetical protein ZTR_05272 [Talaromyces verruculosus]|nr:hypothetical protein ZTR_05272 [Talaromyces verruculosus]